MALVKDTLKKSIYDGFYKILSNQSDKATNGDESEDPKEIIKNIADEMATVVSDAVYEFIKSGDIYVGPSNIVVISSSPGTTAAVSPAQPAKMQ